MKQHLLRLFIVLLILCGIGLIIFSNINTNKAFYLNEYVINEIEKTEDIKTKMNSLSSKIDINFEGYIVVYNTFENSLIYYTNEIGDIKINNTDKNKIKEKFKLFHESLLNFENELNTLEVYLNETNPNANELESLKGLVNNKFKTLNNSFYEINVVLEDFITTNIFNNENLDAVFNINACNNILAKCYLETNNKYDLFYSVNTKLKNLKQNNFNVTDNMVKFSIKFNDMGKATVITDFTNYFTNSLTNENLNILLNYLQTGEYYEEV